MLICISPAKTLDYATPPVTDRYTKPGFLDQSAELIAELRNYSSLDIAELMKLSVKLSDLNFDRYEAWREEVDTSTGKQAVLAMKGDVYTGLDAETLSQEDLDYAQDHLRILSGLYGLLRPLDLMRPYRLEMGTKLKNEKGKDLYAFWGSTITEALNKAMAEQGDDVLINLASNEYFKSVKPKQVAGRVITPQFKENKNGNYKILGVYAKRARGLMSRFIIQNRLETPDHIKDFTEDGYVFNPDLTQGDQWVFTRG